MIQETRIQTRNNLSSNSKGDFVLYWMQASQRTEYNHALEYAVEKANELRKPLLVFFGLLETYPEANERHYYFMLEGLREVQKDLKKRNLGFIIQNISPEIGAAKIAKDACMVVTDRGYLRIEKQWRRFLLGEVNCQLTQVESNLVVPIEVASEKEEFGAYTIRPKINRELSNYLIPLEKRELEIKGIDYDFESLDLNDLESVLKKLSVDKSVGRIKGFTGGTNQALDKLREFIKNKLDKYETMRNNPVFDCQSNLSPYLHFGQISPLQIALEVKKMGKITSEDFLEQLIVRRELSNNFVFYNEGYDNYETLNLPRWAKQTLDEHSKDKREYLYSREKLEQAKTHDPYWNAAQKEMVFLGKMHNYMRMYWGKKILEWTETPQEAHDIALYLNNKYELDGRDANGYTGVAWCFGKHDRPWKERPIFGKVRYMNAAGLERKFDAKGYVNKVEKIIEGESQ